MPHQPGLTIGLWLSRKTDTMLAPVYVLAQLAGAALGALVIWAIAAGAPGSFDPSPKNFAVNGWANLSPGGFAFGAMVVAEIVMTAILVFVVLSTTHRAFSPAAGGLAVGLTLTLIHLISIPVDNTSVNPARSFGVAVIAGGDALQQLWAFFVFPALGAMLGALAWYAVGEVRIPAEPGPGAPLGEDRHAGPGRRRRRVDDDYCRGANTGPGAHTRWWVSEPSSWSSIRRAAGGSGVVL